MQIIINNGNLRRKKHKKFVIRFAFFKFIGYTPIKKKLDNC